MATFNEEHLMNIVWNSREEFNIYLEFFACNNFTSSWGAFNDSWSGNSREINAEFKWDFANVFNLEVFRSRLIVGNLTKVNFIARKFIANKT